MHQQALYPPFLLPRVQLRSALTSAAAQSSDAILGTTAVKTAQLWERAVLRSQEGSAQELCLGLALSSWPLLGYPPGMGAAVPVPRRPSLMDNPAWPWSCSSPRPCLAAADGWLTLVILTSLIAEFCCSMFEIYCLSKRTLSLQGISKSLEINCVLQLYKWN